MCTAALNFQACSSNPAAVTCSVALAERVFRQYEWDASRLRAAIASLGMEAVMQSVKLNTPAGVDSPSDLTTCTVCFCDYTSDEM